MVLKCKKYLILPLILVAFPFVAESQIVYPPEFEENYYQKTKEAISTENGMNSEQATVFYEALYETKRNLFMNNLVYFEDDFSSYIQDLTERVLRTIPGLREEIEVYVTRNASRNAFCMPDGSIFINMGLLASCESEAQLAFIIAHEAGHYEKEHARNRVQKLLLLNEEQEGSDVNEGTFFRSLKYSREDEFESDGFALGTAQEAGFNPKEAAGALKILDDSVVFNIAVPDVIKMLSSELIQLDSSYFDTYDESEYDQGESLKIEEDNELLRTHPNIDKRILAINEIIESMPEAYSGGENYLIKSESDFKNFRSECKYELITNLFQRSEYVTSLLLAIENLHQHPDDQEMKVNVIKNLYQIAYFKEIESIDNILKMNTLGNSNLMPVIKGFVSKVSFNELRKVAFGYTKKELKLTQDDEELLFYYGLITKSYLGNEPARHIFSKYRTAYPNGKYIVYVNTLR